MWTPFPPDGEWTRNASWNEFLDAAIDKTEAAHGLERLRHALPPSRIKLISSKSPHPLMYSYFYRASRYSLIELGAALVRFSPRGISDRLRNPADFVGTMAELRAGLVLQALGVTLKHEPLGHRKAGPDWLATRFDGLSFAAEVKCPLASRRSDLAILAAAELVEVVMRELGRIPRVRPDTGTWLELTPSRAAILLAISNGIVNKARLGELGKQIAWRMGSVVWPLPDGAYEVGDLCTIALKRGAGAEVRFSFSGKAPEWEDEYESKRLYDDVQDAASQLAEVTSSLGIVIIDADRDGSILSLLKDAAEIINTESWASRVAGVLFLARDFPDGVPDCSLHYVARAGADSLAALLDRAHRCALGGLHAQVGVFPQAQCSGWGHSASSLEAIPMSPV